MHSRIRTLIVLLIAIATMAPVCVLSGGDTRTRTVEVELGRGALVEVFGENAAVRISRVYSNSLELTATLHNEEFVDFYTQTMTPIPTDHLVISATTSTGGRTTANSVLDIGLPEGVRLVVRTSNRPITVQGAFLSSASLSTNNGNVAVTNAVGDYDILTTNSEVTIQSVVGSVNASTSNAHVWFDGQITDGANSISTTNGDIAILLQQGSDVSISGTTHNGLVTIDGGDNGVSKDGDTAVISHVVDGGRGILNITNGPGAIHINLDAIEVFDQDS
tara:strand:- start:1248 stop:2075 length:828 start_codon:yes stop_codon:yes gene_type:complete